MEDIEVRKIVRVIDHEDCITYEVSEHEDSKQWLNLSVPETGDVINIRVAAAVKLAKAILEVFDK